MRRSKNTAMYSSGGGSPPHGFPVHPGGIGHYNRTSATVVTVALPWLCVMALVGYLFFSRGTTKELSVAAEDHTSDTDGRLFVSYSYFEKDAIQVLQLAGCLSAQQPSLEHGNLFRGVSIWNPS